MNEMHATHNEKYSWWWYIVLPVVLLMLTAGAYISSVMYPFEFDDLANIVKYFNVRHSTFGSLFFSGSRWIIYWLNMVYYYLSPQHAKLAPFFYRLGNITFHCITGLLIFLLVVLLGRRAAIGTFFKTYYLFFAYLISGLFLLHPVQTQTVSYVIQGQCEGLACLFMVGMCVVFVLLAQTQVRVWRILLFVLLSVLSVLSCGTKEIAIVGPLLLLLLDWFFIAQGSWKSIKSRWWIHATVITLVFSLYIYFLQPAYFIQVFGGTIALHNNLGNTLTETVAQKITPFYFFISQFKVILHYLAIFIWPFSLSVDYDWKLSRSFFEVSSFLPFLILCGIGWYIGSRLRKNPTDLVSFGLLWFFIVTLPRASIVPSTELLADYKTYTASIGLFFVCAYLIMHILVWVYDRYLRSVSTVPKISATGFYSITITLLLSLCAYAAYVRNTVWRSPEEFWLDIIKHAPKKARAFNNYGVTLCEKGDNERAVEYFTQAIALDAFYADPYNNLAVSCHALGKLDTAISIIQKAIRLMPLHPEGYNNLASLLMEKGDFIHVEKLLRRALQLRPHYGKAYYNLGNYYTRSGMPERGWQAYKDACTKADADNHMGFNAFAQASLKLKKYDDAIFAFSKMLELNPQSAVIAVNLANAYFLKQDYTHAQLLYEQLLKIEPHNIGITLQYAETLFIQKKYAEALRCFEQALRIDKRVPAVYLRIARCLDKLNRRPQAQQLLRDFIALQPPATELKQAQEYLAFMK